MNDLAPQAGGGAGAGLRPARHGATPRGQGPLAGRRDGRFGRMFPSLPASDPGEAALAALVAHVAHGSELPGNPRLENTKIPAGYTYVGQFIDHDITFDPASQLERLNDPHALVNFRTPRFDLDSLYGSGPAAQPFLYDWSGGPHPGVKLLLGGGAPGDGLAAVDLPRNQQGRALLGDPRNDENLIVSQLHLLFLRFHNRVVEHVAEHSPQLSATELFTEAQRIVRWHYQWIVAHDFLERITGEPMARSVLVTGGDGEGAAAQTTFYTWQEQPFVPVEFSGAAYRFGHSMVREDYHLNGRGRQPVPIFPPAGSEDRPHLGGERRLPADLVIEWDLFFATATKRTPLLSMRIDPYLVAPLSRLPPNGDSLVRLNLLRGRALGLPAGTDVARAMGVQPLTEEELFLDAPTARLMHDDTREALLRATPLWYYVLCEARRSGRVGGPGGLHLGPVGGRIVAEVLVGLLAGDPQSYLRQAPSWRPELPGCEGDFTMPDLVRFTLGDDA